MTDILATLFLQPIAIRESARLLMVIPLLLAVSVVYKTINTAEIDGARLAISSVLLCFKILIGMVLIAFGLYGMFMLLA